MRLRYKIQRSSAFRRDILQFCFEHISIRVCLCIRWLILRFVLSKAYISEQDSSVLIAIAGTGRFKNIWDNKIAGRVRVPFVFTSETGQS